VIAKNCLRSDVDYSQHPLPGFPPQEEPNVNCPWWKPDSCPDPTFIIKDLGKIPKGVDLTLQVEPYVPNRRVFLFKKPDPGYKKEWGFTFKLPKIGVEIDPEQSSECTLKDDGLGRPRFIGLTPFSNPSLPWQYSFWEGRWHVMHLTEKEVSMSFVRRKKALEVLSCSEGYGSPADLIIPC